jgi:hypothetical protein
MAVATYEAATQILLCGSLYNRTTARMIWFVKPQGERELSDYSDVRRGRPVQVWLILLFGILLVAWMLLAVVLVWSGTVRVETPLETSLAEKWPTIILGLLIVAAAVALFLLRRIARDLFVCALGLDLLLTASHMTQTGWAEELWDGGSVVKLIWHVYLIVACIYAWHLRNKGVLR